MRHFILLMCLVLIGFSAKAHDDKKCDIVLKPVAGIYHQYCPRGTVMDANGTRINTVGNTHFVYDDVRCVKPTLMCGEELETFLKEKVDRERLPDL